jgi:hypothetical protein
VGNPVSGVCGREKATPSWVAFFVSFCLFSEYQIRGENLPNFLSGFGWEVVCFVGM